MMTKSADEYFVVGCMRCNLGGTPQCKVHQWIDPLLLLRGIIHETGLKEECKWGVPCYTLNGKNVLMLSAFKDYCFVSFFKGALLSDPDALLSSPGENSQHTKLYKFTTGLEVLDHKENLLSFIQQAINIEKLGLKVETIPNPEPVPEELLTRMEEIPALKQSFYQLTPGKQRGYKIYISQAKQSISRMKRVDQCIPKILNGEGFHDKYKGQK